MNQEADEVHYYYSDRVGWLRLEATKRGVSKVSFVTDAEGWSKVPLSPVMVKLTNELDAYFAGAQLCFSTPIDVTAGSLFCQTVWHALQKVGYGETISYGGLARFLGSPKAARAVGSAVGRNPVPIIVPCHRVVRSNGSLGGYGPGIEFKIKLLELENILHKNGKLKVVNKD